MGKNCSPSNPAVQGIKKAPTKAHGQMVKAWKKGPEFKAAYDALEAEFALLRELLAARRVTA